MSDAAETTPAETTTAPRQVRQSHLTARRTCGVCGTELPAYAGSGRPSLYCQGTTGRACAQVVKTIATFRAQTEAIAASLAPNKREKYLHAMRGTLRAMSQDLTRTVAQLQGDVERDIAVGSRDPEGFFGD